MGKLKDTIQAAQDIKSESVSIPEWGITLEVRTMRAIDRAKLFRDCIDKQGSVISGKFQAGLIIATCFDPDTGEKIFSDDDYDLVMDKSANIIERLSSIAHKISGFGNETVSSIEKNS
jgi:hypothetical protein